MEKKEYKFRNYYICPKCQEEWDNVWSANSNDMCPKCGIKDIQPYTGFYRLVWKADRFIV